MKVFQVILIEIAITIYVLSIQSFLFTYYASLQVPLHPGEQVWPGQSKPVQGVVRSGGMQFHELTGPPLNPPLMVLLLSLFISVTKLFTIRLEGFNFFVFIVITIVKLIAYSIELFDFR